MTRRCAGGKWRLLAHHRLERKAPDGTLYDVTHSIGSSEELTGPDREDHSATVLEDTEFDELVVGSFLHVEQMGAGDWWLDIAGLVVNVSADRDGRPRKVTVELEEREGVEYRTDLIGGASALPGLQRPGVRAAPHRPGAAGIAAVPVTGHRARVGDPARHRA